MAPLIGLILFSTSALLLGVAWFVRPHLEPQGPRLLSLVACGWALLSPLAAVLVRGEGLIAPPRPAAEGASPGRRIAFFAVLESAVVLCAAALLVGRLEWPLLAAALPLALMLVNVPRPGS